MENELTKLKDQIEYCLINYPETRNSDIELTICVWTKYYQVGVTIRLAQLYDLPSQDSVKRIRANFQNVDHKYLPTSEMVALERHWKIEEWRALLGYGLQGELFNEII